MKKRVTSPQERGASQDVDRSNGKDISALKRNVAQAHRQADRDMKDDVELNAPDKGRDLDEGEAARSGNDRSDII